MDGPQQESRAPLGFRSRTHEVVVLVVALAVLLAAAALEVTPAGDGVTLGGQRLPESCLFRRVTGSGCPGCGLTRSFVRGVRLDPGAFRLHPLGPLLLAAVAFQVPYRLFRLWRPAPLRLSDGRVAMWAMAGGIATLLGVWGARAAGVLP